MPAVEKLNVLIVDANPNRRSRLKQMLQNIHVYQDLVTTYDPAEGASKISLAENPISAVMFSAEFSNEQLRTMFDEIEALEVKDPVVLLGICSGVGQELSEEELVLLGVHGHIREPFSVEELKERGELAREQLEVLKDERCKQAIEELIHNLSINIDDLSVFLKAGLEPTKYIQELKQLKSRLDTYARENESLVEELLMQTLIDAPAPTPSYLPKGISTGERRKLLKGIRSGSGKSGFSLQQEEKSDSAIIEGRGKLSSKYFSSDLKCVMDRLLDERCSDAVLDLSQATELNPMVIVAALQYKKRFKQKNGRFRITGDKGIVKHFLSNLKKIKLAN